jgi:hypothetical protein
MDRISTLPRSLVVVLGILVILVTGIAVAEYFPTTSNQGYAPEQPIPFSHKLHAGQYKMPCAYCHVGVEKSRHATVPALNVCMNCHTLVKTQSPHIKKLREHFYAGKPVEWVRVHELPDFVYFPHKRHVAVGVSCQTCHGPVETMDVVQQHAPLNMGWCMNCHRGSTTPAAVLKTIAQVRPEVLAPGSGHKPVAAVSCVVCHH